MDQDNLVKALRAKKAPHTKIDRSAFLYLEGDDKNFAQCASCHEFDKDRGKCAIFGAGPDVDADDSCAYYLKGTYNGQELKEIVTPEEAGFVKGKQVRCENCFYGGKDCGLFQKLNKELPEIFDLDIKIKPLGCCNGWVQK